MDFHSFQQLLELRDQTSREVDYDAGKLAEFSSQLLPILQGLDFEHNEDLMWGVSEYFGDFLDLVGLVRLVDP